MILYFECKKRLIHIYSSISYHTTDIVPVYQFNLISSLHRYGWQFLFETYLYHIVRGDIRHNFSPYFYLLYLTSSPEGGVPLCLRLLVFLPQALLLLVMSFKFYHQPGLCWFLTVFVFVAFNKVCTSQVRDRSLCHLKSSDGY